MKKGFSTTLLLLFLTSLLYGQTITNYGSLSGTAGTNSSYFGYKAGQFAKASNAVFLGVSTGIKNEGNDNTFVGFVAGSNNTKGTHNTFLGSSAGRFNTTARYNTYVGYAAGHKNTTGERNSFVGMYSGYNNIKGFRNTAQGMYSGYAIENGSNNTYIGYQAGYKNTKGNNNVFLGYTAGYSELGEQKLYIENSTSAKPLIWGDFKADYVNINGKLGVGTTAPKSKLDLASNYSDPSTYPNKITLWSGGVNNYFGFGVSSGDLDYFTQSNHRFYTGYNGTPGVERMVINGKGNVGIGTAEPNAKLEINTGATQLRLNGDGGIYGYNINVNTTGGWAREMSFSSNNKLRAHMGALGGNNSLNYLYFDTNSETIGDAYKAPEMVITKAGNVGIGTASPDARLAVKGHIHTQEVRVDLAGAIAPDYVFESDYDLLSLQEIEAYIKKNKHLPEIPSAKKMEEEGVELKMMNLRLLRKIEELTLHTIQQQKEITLQQQQNDELKAQFLKLEALVKKMSN